MDGGESDPVPENIGERKLPSCIIIGLTFYMSSKPLQSIKSASRCEKRRHQGSPRDAFPPPSGEDGTAGFWNILFFYFIFLFTSGEKAGKPNRNLTMVHLFLKILKCDIKSWKHSQNLGSLFFSVF